MSEISEEIKKYLESRSWLAVNMREVKKKFRGRYIAVLGKRIIDSDRDKSSLLGRLWSQGMIPGPVLIERID